jgi:hypothetical protein
LEYENFVAELKEEFNAIFYLPQDKSSGHNFKIEYKFSNGAQEADITIKNDDNAIRIESNFLKGLLDDWKEYLKKRESDTPDGFEELKLSFYNDILKMFGGRFPISTTFIPASRAALAFGSVSGDEYLKEYDGLINNLHRFQDRNLDLIDTILKAKIINDKGKLWLESNDGRKVPIAKASSGQQEIIYVLMLLRKLGNFQYKYGKAQSVFIEETSAHLFPLEQKLTIELIVQMFNLLKEESTPVRFFITTHSPYILNSLNNILKKGGLLEKYSGRKDEINNAVSIPHLFTKEISAYFISNDGVGKNMLDKRRKYMNDDRIAEISYSIDEDSRKLSELKNEFFDDGAQID